MKFLSDVLPYRSNIMRISEKFVNEIVGYMYTNKNKLKVC